MISVRAYNWEGTLFVQTRIYRQRMLLLVPVALFAITGCRHRSESNAFPSGSLMEDTIRFQYAVYMPGKHGRNPSSILREMLGKDFPRLRLVEKFPEKPSEMLVRARLEPHARETYPPPSVELLQYSGEGLSAKQGQELQDYKEAYILDFSHPKEDVWEAMHSADQLIERIARETGGLVWDETTREVFTPDVWHAKRLKEWTGLMPEISTHTVVHVYKNGEFDRAISLGMSKLGLPDLVIEELDESSADQVVTMINAMSQLLAEGAVTRRSGKLKLDLRSVQNEAMRSRELKSLKPNATGTACVTLKITKPEDGDPDNRLIQLAFDEYHGNDRHSQQQDAIDGLFGWKDSVLYVEHTDELLEMSRKAKAELPRLRELFVQGVKPGEYILVKSPFDVPGGGHEWMWVEVRSWNGNEIEGILENTPDKIPSLHVGQVVHVRENEVFDYQRHFPDGHEEGNTTGELLSKFEQKTEKVISTHKSPFVPDCKD
jgi:uncharacterized protein YegJ (DUF2314 family)